MPDGQAVPPVDPEEAYALWREAMVKAKALPEDADSDPSFQYDLRRVFQDKADITGGVIPPTYRGPLHPSRYAKDEAGRVIDTATGMEVLSGVEGGEALLERQSRVSAAAEALKKHPGFAAVPEWRRIALKALYDEATLEADSKPGSWDTASVQPVREAAKRIPNPEAVDQWMRPLPESLASEEYQALTRSYLDFLDSAGDDRPHTRFGMTPHRYVKMIEAAYAERGESLSAETRLGIRKWANEFQNFETMGNPEHARYKKRTPIEEEMQSLFEAIESGELSPADEAQAKASLESLMKSDFAQRNWDTYNTAEKGVAQAVVGSNEFLNNYLPKLGEAVKYGVTNLGRMANNREIAAYGENLDSMTDGSMHPQEKTEWAARLGGTAGMMKSPIAKLFGGAGGAAKAAGLMGRGAQALSFAKSGAAAFATIAGANEIADEVIGNYDAKTGDWNTYAERLEKEATKHALNWKGMGPAEMQKQKRIYIEKHGASFIKRLTVNALNSAAQGAMQGALEPVGNLLKFQVQRLVPKASPYMADLLGEVTKNALINMTAGAAPQAHVEEGGRVGWDFLLTDLADPNKSEGAVQGLIFNGLVSAFGGLMSARRGGSIGTDTLQRAIEGVRGITPEQVDFIRQKIMADPQYGPQMLQALEAVAQQTVEAMKAHNQETGGRMTHASLMEGLQSSFDEVFQGAMKSIDAIAKEHEKIAAAPVDEAAALADAAPKPVERKDRIKKGRDLITTFAETKAREAAEAEAKKPGAAAKPDAVAQTTEPGKAPAEASTAEKPVDPHNDPVSEAMPTRDQVVAEAEKRRAAENAEARKPYGVNDGDKVSFKGPDGKDITGTVEGFEAKNSFGKDRPRFRVKVDGAAEPEWVSPEQIGKGIRTTQDAVGVTPDGKEVEGKVSTRVVAPDGTESVVLEVGGKDVTVPAETLRVPDAAAPARRSRKKKTAEEAKAKADAGLMPRSEAEAVARDEKTVSSTVARAGFPDSDEGRAGFQEIKEDIPTDAGTLKPGYFLEDQPAPVAEKESAADFEWRDGGLFVKPEGGEFSKAGFEGYDSHTISVERDDTGRYRIALRFPVGGSSDVRRTYMKDPKRGMNLTFTSAEKAKAWVEGKIGLKAKGAPALARGAPEATVVEAVPATGNVDPGFEVTTPDGSKKRFETREAALDYARTSGAEAVKDLFSGKDLRTVYTGIGGRKMGFHQARVEEELTQAMSKTDGKLPNDPVAQAVAVLLTESKMRSLAGHLGEHLDDTYARARVEYMSAKGFEEWKAKSGAESMKRTFAEWTGPMLDKFIPAPKDGQKGTADNPVIHPINGRVYSPDELRSGSIRVTNEDVIRAALAGARNRNWYTEALTGTRKHVPAEDQEVFTALSAAASNGNTPDAEIKTASQMYEWYRTQKANGLSPEQIAEKWNGSKEGWTENGDSRLITIPGTRAKSIRQAVGRYLRDGKFDLSTAPKVGRYFLNRMGDGSVVTRDRWDLRFLGLAANDSLTPAMREKADRLYKEVADQLGWTPAEVQASIWLTMKWRSYQNDILQREARWLHGRGISWNVLAKVANGGKGGPELAAYMERKTADMTAGQRKAAYARVEKILDAMNQKAGVVPPDFVPDDSSAAGSIQKYLAGRFMDATPGAKNPRGMVTFLENGTKALVHLLDGADVSTVAHEFGHLVSHFMPDSVRREIKAFFGRDPEEELSRNEEEILARLYENYDVNGKAPSPSLEGAFSRANNWIAQTLERIGPDLKKRLAAQSESKRPDRQSASRLMDLLYSKTGEAQGVEGSEKNVSNVEDSAADIQRSQGLPDDEVISSADPEAIAARKLAEGEAEQAAEAADEARPGAPTTEAEVAAAAKALREEREANSATKVETVSERDLEVMEQADLDLEEAEKAPHPKDLPGPEPTKTVAAEPLDFERIRGNLGRAVQSDAQDTAAVRAHVSDQPVGTVLRVTTKDGSVYTGKFEGDTGTRIIVGKTRVRGSDIASVEKLTRPADDTAAAAIFDAATTGDAKALTEAINKAMAERAAKAADGIDKGTLFDSDDDLGGEEPPIRVGAADYKEMEKAGVFRNRRRGTGDSEIVESDAGTFRLTRSGDSISLDPVDAIDLPADSTPPTVGGMPVPKGEKNLFARLEKAFDAIPGKLGYDWVVDRIFDAASNLLFSPNRKGSATLRKNFTELDADPEIAKIRNELLGERFLFKKNVLAPLLDLAEKSGYTLKDKKKMAEFGRALFEGRDLPDAPELTKAFRKAFQDVGRRMVEEGAISQETYETHKDSYFPLLNWATLDPKKTLKEIKGLENKRKSKGLTPEEALQLKSLRLRYNEATKPVKTPDDLIHKTGNVSKNLIDGRDVNAGKGRLRARLTDTWEEAVNKGLNIENTVADAMAGLLQEHALVTRLSLFRRVRDYGTSTSDGLVLRPEKDSPEKPGYVLVRGKDINGMGLKTFGALEDHYVKDRLWSDLEVYSHSPGEAERVWNILHAGAKEAATVFRLGGHIVQRVGNPILWSLMADVPFARAREVAMNGRALINHGFLKDRSIRVEVNGRMVEPTLERLAEWGVVAPDPEVALGMDKELDLDIGREKGRFESMAEGFVGAAQALMPAKKALRKAYGAPDQYSRAGLYIYFRQHAGLGHDAAVSKVREMYDATNVPRGIRKLSKGISFFRFQYIMARNGRQIAKNTPAVMAKAIGLMALLRYGHRQALGMSDEEYERALWAAYPGDSFGATIKRLTAIPWLPEWGGGKSKAGWVSIWNMFPQQTALQLVPGMSDSPAEEKPGGWFRRAADFLVGGMNIMVKPIGELANNRDSWSGQPRLLQTRYGADEESDASMGIAGARHVVSPFIPSFLREGFRAADSAVGGIPGVSVRRPNGDGNFPSAADETARALGASVRRPDYGRAEAVKAREALEKDPSAYADDEGRYVPRSSATDEDKRRIQQKNKEMKATLAAASGRRALRWLRDGDEENAIKEIRTRTRLKAMAKDLGEDDAQELWSLVSGIYERLKD